MSARLAPSSQASRLSDERSLEFRVEAFNVFNHAQFYGGNSVDGNIGDQIIGPGGRVDPANPGSFGTVTKAADPRIGQIAAKFRF